MWFGSSFARVPLPLYLTEDTVVFFLLTVGSDDTQIPAWPVRFLSGLHPTRSEAGHGDVVVWRSCISPHYVTGTPGILNLSPCPCLRPRSPFPPIRRVQDVAVILGYAFVLLWLGPTALPLPSVPQLFLKDLWGTVSHMSGNELCSDIQLSRNPAALVYTTFLGTAGLRGPLVTPHQSSH